MSTDAGPKPIRTASPRRPSPVLLLPLSLAVGCTSIPELCEPEERPLYVLTLHEIAPDNLYPGRTVRRVQSYDGRTMLSIVTVPRLTSRDIITATFEEPDTEPDAEPDISPKPRHALPDDSEATVLAHLNRRGALRWMQLCREQPGRPVAVVIDGFYRFTMTVPPRVDDVRTIRIRGNWKEAEARAFAEQAVANYRIMNEKFR